MEMLMSIFTVISILSTVPAIESACVKLEGTLSCLDFNCSLSWNTMANIEPGSHVTFSLYYAKAFTAHDIVQHWEAVEGCVNMSSTSCNVRALFKDDDDFRGNKRFRIDYITNGTEECQGRKFQRDPLKSVVLSAPPITHIDMTSQELSFRLIYPTDHHYPELDLQLLRQFVNHKYHVDISEYETNLTIQDYVIKNDLSRIQRIYDLLPATRYIIRVRSAVYPPVVWSPDTTFEVVKTLEKPPSIGPTDLKLVNSNFECVHPDQREIVLKWKAVEEEDWNGDLIFYEVRAILFESRETHISHIVNISSTMVSLKSLSRWEDYEVVVFANNSAGGTRNNIPLQLKRHIIDERGSQPSSVSISSDQRGMTVIHWKPPTHYQECIMGYGITWTDGQNREHHVFESERTLVDVKGHVMKVEVTPLLREDYDSSQKGTALIYSNNTGSGFNLLFLLVIGVAVLVLVVAVLLVAKWKYIKLRWLKPQFKNNFNLEHNRVLKPAFDRQVSYEPCLRQEKEIFDAPSPGIHNPSELPSWSPDFVPTTIDEHELPLMTALLQRGLTVVDDIDEIDLAQAAHDAILESNPINASSKYRGSQTSSKTDSAIDTLSYSDVDDCDIETPIASPDDGYIAHHNLQEHLQAMDHIDDYTVTGLSGYIPVDSCGDLPTGSGCKVTSIPHDAPVPEYHVTEDINDYTVAGVKENVATPSPHNSSTHFTSAKKVTSDCDQISYVPQNSDAPGTTGQSHQSGFPGKAQKFVSPYVPHSEVMQSSSCSSDRSGEDIADYSKQTVSSNIPINNQTQTHLTGGNVMKHEKQDLEKQTKRGKTPATAGPTITHDEETLKSIQRERASVLPISRENCLSGSP